MSKPPSITLALALLVAGCQGASASFDEGIGVARQADSPAPSVGLPFDLAPPAMVPTAIDTFSIASRGDDFLAAFQLGSLAEPNGALRAVRFDASGKPTADPILLVDVPKHYGRGAIAGMACAPDGDCVVAATALQNNGSGSKLFVVTLRADGSITRHNFTFAGAGTAPTAPVAFDIDADAFLVAWSGRGDGAARHFKNGAPVEDRATPLPDSTPLGVACLAGHGCLVTVAPKMGSGTSGVRVDGDVAAAPVPISPDPLSHLASGGGVYAAIAPAGLVRIDADGALLDAVPIPLPAIERDFKSDGGLDYDGAGFVALVNGYDQPEGVPSNTAVEAARVSADGTALAPILLPAGMGPAGDISCGSATCQVALPIDARGLDGASTVVLHDGIGEASAFDLVTQSGSQTPVTALAVGSRIVVAWNEGKVARARFFTGAGRPDGDPIELGSPFTVRDGSARGDRGLLIVGDATRPVSADGTIGDPIALVLPTETSNEPAAFATTIAVPSSNNPDAYRILRFDTAGHALDPGTVIEPDSGALGGRGRKRPAPLVGRVGDTFLFVTSQAKAGALNVTRMRDTGELLGTTAPMLSALGQAEGIACNTDGCALVLGSSSQAASRPFRFATLSADGERVTIGQGSFSSSGARVAFDGRHFIGMVARNPNLEATRVDDGSLKFGSSPLNSDLLGPVASTGEGDVVVVGFQSSDFERSQASIRTITQGTNQGGGGGSGGSNVSDSGSTAFPPVSAGGCGCRIDERDAGGSWLALAALGLGFGLSRRPSSRRRRCPARSSRSSRGLPSPRR